MEQERFAWLCDVQLSPHNLLLATGAGYCTMAREPQAYATVAQLRQGTRPGMLLSASALLSLRDSARRAFVLIQRSPSAPTNPGKWHFPAGRSAVDEPPLTTACRELAEEVRLEAAGLLLPWNGCRIRVGGLPVTLLRDSAVDEFLGRFVVLNNTIEFFYPMELEVRSLDEVALSDNESFGRHVALFDAQDVERLARSAMLSDVATAIWDAAIAEGVATLP